MNKRQRKKNKKKPGFFVGRLSSIGVMFWPNMIERYQAQLDSGIMRHSKRREKLIFKIRKLEYLIWEHKACRKVMYETMNRLKHLNDEEKLKRMAAVDAQVRLEMWQEHRRQKNA